MYQTKITVKCVFFASSVDFLGQHVSAEGIRPLDTRVAAIEAYPRQFLKNLRFNFH